MQVSESGVGRGASQSSHVSMEGDSVRIGSETAGLGEGIGQKLCREDCRCGGDGAVRFACDGGECSVLGGDRAAEKSLWYVVAEDRKPSQ